MNANKIVLNDEVLVDLTQDTVAEGDVKQGKTFHKADGTQATGTSTAIVPSGSLDVIANGDYDVTKYESVAVRVSGGSDEPEEPEEDDSWWNTVNFYDYDGTLLYSYPVDEMQTATELPPLPSHDGLICQGWNWTLAKIKEYNVPIDVGANYVTDDGTTKLYVNCFDEEHLTAAFRFVSAYAAESIIVNYGDGNQEEYSVEKGRTGAEVTHTYSTTGEYVISISTKYLSTSIYVYLNGANNFDNSEVYTKIQCGDNIQSITAQCCNNLETISISNSITSVSAKCATKLKALIGGPSTTIAQAEEGLLNCQSLEVVSFSVAQSRLETRAFSNCNSLKRLTIPKGVSQVYNYTSGDGCKSLELLVYGPSRIASRAWMSCSNLKKVILSDELTSFPEYYTFRSTAIKDIQLPENMTSIGTGYAFQLCYELESVTLPKMITTIPKYTFQDCKNLKSVDIPDGVTLIDQYAFNGCTSLKSITIPDSVTSIGSNAFEGCTSLKSITIPDSVITINSAAFKDCTNLTDVVISKGVNKIADNLFYNCSKLERVTGYENITSIGQYAFNGCTSLKSITIPDSVTSIGSNAFYLCSSIEEIVIPASVTASLSNKLFGYNNRLKTVVFNNRPTTIGDFNYASALEEIGIPDSVTSLGTFAYSHGLIRIDMPDSVTSIPSSCFSNCISLRDVRLSERITTIPSNAFDACKILSHIKIPKSVNRLEDKCFYSNVSNLRTYDFTEHESVPTLATTSTIGINSNMQILVPSMLYDEWKSATNWTSLANYIVKAGNYLQNEPIKFASLYNTTETISLRYVPEDDSLATNLSITASVPNIITISNQNITADTISFDITSLETDGDVTVTVSADIGGETLSSEVVISVCETMPEPTYKVETVDAFTYGFELNADEYYESTNKAIGNSYSICKLTFNTYGTHNLILDCINYAQSNYDYGLLSNVDTKLTLSYSADTSNVYKTFKTLHSANVVSVNYGNADNYEHFIYIKYIKNGSYNYNNDSLKFQVRFEAV